MSETPNFFAVIPANVRYNKELSPREVLLYAEISALCHKEGYCWAHNKYLAELCGVSLVHISRMIKALQDKGFIRIVINRQDGNVRHIYLDTTAHVEERAPINADVNTLLTPMLRPININVNSLYKGINNTSKNTERYGADPPPKSLSLQKFTNIFPDKVIDCDFSDAKFDMDLLIAKVQESKWLQINGMRLSWLLKRYQKIIADEYKDFVRPKKDTRPPGISRHEYSAADFAQMFATNLDEVGF